MATNGAPESWEDADDMAAKLNALNVNAPSFVPNVNAAVFVPSFGPPQPAAEVPPAPVAAAPTEAAPVANPPSPAVSWSYQYFLHYLLILKVKFC